MLTLNSGVSGCATPVIHRQSVSVSFTNAGYIMSSHELFVSAVHFQLNLWVCSSFFLHSEIVTDSRRLSQLMSHTCPAWTASCKPCAHCKPCPHDLRLWDLN